MRLLLYFFLWISSLGLAIFSSQNIYPIAVKFISFESIKLPLGLVLIFCAGLGATSMAFLQTSIQFTLPNVPKPANSTTASKNEFIKTKQKTKQKTKDDFDDEWNDEWS